MQKRVYKFRIYPNRQQEYSLAKTLENCRFLYNKQLESKINRYKEDKTNLSQFDLNNNLIELKEKNKDFYKIYGQVLQEINKRINLAFSNFYRKIKKGEKAGFPRFKTKNRYNSITYPQYGFKLEKNQLYLSKIGSVNLVKHREIKGKIKTLTIKKTSSNKWYVYFSVEKETENKSTLNDNSVGIDLGLNHFYADSEGNLKDNPRYLRKTEKKLKIIQRKLSRKKKGSKNRNKYRLKLAKVHERISNQRLDFLHKESRYLANNYNLIAVEKLKIQNMTKNHYLAKSINDASWNKFLQLLSYKVEETGGKLVGIDPRNTSQSCICGNKVEKTLVVRIHKCSNCKIEINRDVMSAMIIKALAFSHIESSTMSNMESNALGDISVETSMNQEPSKVFSKLN